MDPLNSPLSVSSFPPSFFFFPCTHSLSLLFGSKGSEDLNYSCQAYSLPETIHVLCGLALSNSSLSNPFPGGCAEHLPCYLKVPWEGRCLEQPAWIEPAPGLLLFLEQYGSANLSATSCIHTQWTNVFFFFKVWVLLWIMYVGSIACSFMPCRPAVTVRSCWHVYPSCYWKERSVLVQLRV